MINVQAKKENGHYKSFHINGHAMYAEAGSDIVCAAVSALVINTINAMDELADEQLQVTTNEETGFIRCVFTGKPSEKSILLMDALLLGLDGISKQYGEKFLQVKFEEV